MKGFINLFNFDPRHAMSVDLEKECFLSRNGEHIEPIAYQVLMQIILRNVNSKLPACQMRYKTGMVKIQQLSEQAELMEMALTVGERNIGFRRIFQEVGPDNVPCDVFPDPAGTYQSDAAKMSPDELKTSCQITSTSVHVGMPDAATALRVYNWSIRATERLCSAGDGSDGRRLKLYRLIYSSCDPKPYSDWSEFYEDARQNGFADDPRINRRLIRITPQGAITFSTFGIAADPEQELLWAQTCQSICQEAA